MTVPAPIEIKLLQKKHLLEVTFEDGKHFALPCEYLRVYSPSAEVQGHGAGQQTLQTGKKDVNITGIDPVGQYAVKLIFDDGHSSGLYSWEKLYELGTHYETYWQEYLDKLVAAGAQR